MVNAHLVGDEWGRGYVNGFNCHEYILSFIKFSIGFVLFVSPQVMELTIGEGI